jgi:predicted amidohydrolase
MLAWSAGLALVTASARAADPPPRVVTLSSGCLLNGRPYETREVVLAELAKSPQGADLVVLPLLPFLSFRTEQAEAELGPFLAFARERRTYLAFALAEADGAKTYHTALLADREGRLCGRYRKTHAFPDDAVALGSDLPVFSTDFGKVGLTVSTDIYFPEIYMVLSMNGADVITWHDYPERLRDHSGWEPLLMARCLDSHAHLATAMYADPRTYITHNYESGMPGAAWGRSMVLNRVGTPLADTGYEEGWATARVDLDKRKLDVYDTYRQAESIFIPNNTGDRRAFGPLAEPYRKPALPTYAKRTCRLAVGTFARADIWRQGAVPEAMLRLIDRAAALKPDLLLLSEQGANVQDETTRQVIKTVSEKAAALRCYIAIGGIGDQEQLSILRVWDRTGKEIHGEPLYWIKGFPEIKVFDTDFGRVGAYECGDLYIWEIQRVLALLGAELLIDASQMWGASGRTNETMLRARALDNGVWLACSHWLSSDPSLRSLIIDPYGQIMAASAYQREGLIHTDIDLNDSRVYYAGKKTNQATPGKTDIPSYYTDNLPEQRPGWRDMVFAARRPELYGIIPTVNDVIRRYRPPK